MIWDKVRWRRHRRHDLFVQTQQRLTIKYSVLMMIFLLIFIVTVYVLVSITMTRGQEVQLHKVVDEELELVEEAIRNNTLTNSQIDDLNFIRDNSNQFFYYLVDAQGNVLYGDEYIHRQRPVLLNLVKGWIPNQDDIRYETLEPIIPPSGKPSPNARTIHMLITGRAIYDGNRLAGVFYAGSDIGPINDTIFGMLVVLAVLAILFWGISFLFSYFMSKRAMAPIRESFSRQQEFVADASHELRTPLSILHSSLDVFELEEGEGLTEMSRKVLYNMKDEVKRMASLIGDLLTLARSNSELPALHYEEFDVIPPVHQIVNATRVLAQSKGVSLTFHGPPALIVQCDRERLKQLFYILLDNAIKYTSDGGEVKLEVSMDVAAKKRSVCIRVQDTGIGIAKHDLKRIFDRFYRVNKNRSRQMGGAGLGLSIAKWIVDAHQGTMEADSVVQKGTTFTVRLPLHRPKA